MFVCICHAITEKDIAAAVEQGAGTMKELREQLNVASQCGKCVQFAKNILTDMTVNYDLAVEAA
ncbi:bacterioferritin-associated ferredoxin [Thalassotalea sp. ND16A]|uniref:bacterioferritin-associated ferredoxin n=1 Tax=Thalassotalea sp. ND16A TaxID=1535422 RepID=UPI000519F6E5|nr:bacterioferritin-associated ferredoxin [Thalassotalea sp. ND16A]KGJ98008.1 bfd, bacterioferritin-associated ferredoxin [Thalassotalea sp. ND16A]